MWSRTRLGEGFNHLIFTWFNLIYTTLRNHGVSFSYLGKTPAYRIQIAPNLMERSPRLFRLLHWRKLSSAFVAISQEFQKAISIVLVSLVAIICTPLDGDPQYLFCHSRITSWNCVHGLRLIFFNSHFLISNDTLSITHPMKYALKF